MTRIERARAQRGKSDAELIERIACDDMEALGALYDRHYDAVLRFAFRATSRHEAEDITQATFLTAARVAKSYDGRLSARPWLFGITVNIVRQRRRAASRFRNMLLSFAWWSDKRSFDPTGRNDARSQLSAIDRALARLSHAKRVVVLMAEVEDIPAEDIALALGIPVGTVWTRLHAARRELRAALAGQESR
jgi:RNA polymerase sigma factor (sigma-70 family)